MNRTAISAATVLAMVAAYVGALAAMARTAHSAGDINDA